jgi:hypothetical protein
MPRPIDAAAAADETSRGPAPTAGAEAGARDAFQWIEYPRR